VQGLCFDIPALFGTRPELDTLRTVVYVFADSYDIIKEMFGIEFRVLSERDIYWFNTYHSVEREVEQKKIVCL
jgi:hypothetical protein